MGGQQTPQNATEILATATPEQVRWVQARLHAKSDSEAARKVGVHRSTVSRWSNKSDLDRVVALLLAAPVEAAVFQLKQSSTKAAKALEDALGDKRTKVSAANSILDRVGVLAAHRTEHTGPDGEPLQDIVRIVIHDGDGS